MAYRLGADIGGTFTDLAVVDSGTGEIEVFKSPTNPANPVESIVEAVFEGGISADEVDLFIHGTTVATNVLIERKGGQVGFVTNKGFKDIIFIQYANRKYRYNLEWVKPKPLVKRRDCFELFCRIDKSGNVVKDLDQEEIENLARELKDRKIEAVAVCFLFSYLNPVHEKAVGQRLKSLCPELHISLSHESYPKWREYDRASTTICDAYVKPMFMPYAKNLMDGLKKIGMNCPLLLSKSNGGITRLETAPEQPIHSIMSGPVAGVLAGIFFGQLTGHDSVLTLDMGGTSCDVSLIQDGNLPYTSDCEIDFGIPIRIPMVDVHTIGAGGGSIGWIDKGGLLHVGPYSAGADPGPACYGKGGKEPTVTDANLLLGRLSSDYFCGGKMKLSVDLAKRAIAKLSEKADTKVEETAEAILTIAVHNMVDALSLVSTQRGIDPREFALIAFGGAGGLHATQIASVLDIPKVVIPIYPGNTSALGLLTADLRADFAKSILLRSDRPDVLERINESLYELRKQAFEELRREGFSGVPQIIQTLEMRYYWQNYSRPIAVPAKESLSQEDLTRCYEAFHQDHKEFYGFNMPENPIEIVEISGTLVGSTKPLKLKRIPIKKQNIQPKERRKLYVNKNIGFVNAPIFERAHLFSGFSIEGPAVIEEPFSTTLVLPRQSAHVDEYGNICISIEASK